MERTLIVFAILLMLAAALSTSCALAAWAREKDGWGLYFGLVGLLSSLGALRIVQSRVSDS